MEFCSVANNWCDELPYQAAQLAADEAHRRNLCDGHRFAPTPQTWIPNIRLAGGLIEALWTHLLSDRQRWDMGYPTEVEGQPGKAIVLINAPYRAPLLVATLDASASEFIPRGQDSACTAPLESVHRSGSEEEQICVRCRKSYIVTSDGDNAMEEFCKYHWGKYGRDARFSCCNALCGSTGCTLAASHVRSGTKPGVNELHGYVRTRFPRGGIYAIDTEMIYTTAGLELASVVVLATDGQILYESLVKPSSPVVDYNTRFSGIRARDLTYVTKTLADVQRELLDFIGTDTILIGHALENDLRALKLIHSAVVDTSALYPHFRGMPWRRPLRDLAQEFLGRSIQTGKSGHSPLEDAQAAMELVLLKVQEEQR